MGFAHGGRGNAETERHTVGHRKRARRCKTRPKHKGKWPERKNIERKTEEGRMRQWKGGYGKA